MGLICPCKELCLSFPYRDVVLLLHLHKNGRAGEIQALGGGVGTTDPLLHPNTAEGLG